MNGVLYAHRRCDYDKVQETSVTGPVLLLGHAEQTIGKQIWEITRKKKKKKLVHSLASNPCRIAPEESLQRHDIATEGCTKESRENSGMWLVILALRQAPICPHRRKF